MEFCFISVFHNIRTRMHKGRLFGTGISRALIIGTWVQPICLAAKAGKAEEMSSVVVKSALAMSTGFRSGLAARIAPSNSWTAESTLSLESESIVVAPRIPRVVIMPPKNKKSEPFGSLYLDTQEIIFLPTA
jgi:hypothetical protein